MAIHGKPPLNVPLELCGLEGNERGGYNFMFLLSKPAGQDDLMFTIEVKEMDFRYIFGNKLWDAVGQDDSPLDTDKEYK